MDEKNKEKDKGNGEKPQKKISAAELALITPVLVLSDIADVVANLLVAVPVVGEVTVIGASIANFIIMAGFQFYLFMKGIRNMAFLAGAVIDIIPGVDILPAKTLGWIALVIMVNNPKLEKVASVASGKAAAVIKK